MCCCHGQWLAILILMLGSTVLASKDDASAMVAVMLGLGIQIHNLWLSTCMLCSAAWADCSNHRSTDVGSLFSWIVLMVLSNQSGVTVMHRNITNGELDVSCILIFDSSISWVVITPVQWCIEFGLYSGMIPELILFKLEYACSSWQVSYLPWLFSGVCCYRGSNSSTLEIAHCCKAAITSVSPISVWSVLALINSFCPATSFGERTLLITLFDFCTLLICGLLILWQASILMELIAAENKRLSVCCCVSTLAVE